MEHMNIETGDIVEINGNPNYRGRFQGWTTEGKPIVSVHNGDTRMGYEGDVTRIYESVVKSDKTTY